MRKLFICCGLFSSVLGQLSGETLVWNGEVDSNGNPSIPVELKIGEFYFLRVNGKVNLGKWTLHGEKLANDACYEFSPSKSINKLETFKNSFNLSVCDGSYHPNHIYESKPFKAEQNRIHCWVNDIDYDDNVGSFQVQIFKVDGEKEDAKEE